MNNFILENKYKNIIKNIKNLFNFLIFFKLKEKKNKKNFLISYIQHNILIKK